MSAQLRELRRGSRGEPVRELQAATNRRLRAAGLGALVVEEDGDLGDRSLAAVRKAAWRLGALKENYDAVTQDGRVSVGVQRMIRNPGRRSAPQRQRGRARMAALRKLRQQQAEHARAQGARGRAVSAFLARVGTREQPPGSNSGGSITTWESFWGFGRVPWCGISAGYHAKVFGGVAELRSDVAGVAAIERHARAGHAPYGRWQSSPRGALPGSFVVIGGSGVHVGMLVQAMPDGWAKTVEGNTSFGPGGSQSNGGCVAARLRSPREIYGVATMSYPED